MVQPLNSEMRHHTAVATPNNAHHFVDQNLNAAWEVIIDNMNIILQKQAYNRFKYIIPPNCQRQWVVPYRLRDCTPAPSTRRDGTIVPGNDPLGHRPPRNRNQLVRYTLAQWYALADHYEFDWRQSQMDIGECRGYWAAWCGANIGNGSVIQAAVQELAYLPPAPAHVIAAAAAAGTITIDGGKHGSSSGGAASNSGTKGSNGK
ncbi:hypothetical protein BJ508DRAFT_315549 [Ascobolus immersus RN42]|uniref:Uncharacterized protein n=1 Tax=Ascobolus immersus RN42 TaxID=1160509 RepID=A0A3N4HF44_ASCIM|nr:hypothetical protein BJ508DRAFT_315549 [Ascobolus immersus RN42]